MRLTGIFLLVSLVTAGCAASTAPTRPGFAPLRGADCLDPSSARSWEDVSMNELRVDAGRRHYRITLAGCGRIGIGPALHFAGDPISGHVCGVPGDAVLIDGQRCPIERLEIIDVSPAAVPSNDGSAGRARNRDRSSPA